VKAEAPGAFIPALTPIAGVTGTVNISCSGLPSGAACSTVPMDLNGQKTTTTVTVTTTAARSLVRHVWPDDRSILYADIFLGGAILAFGYRRRGAVRGFAVLFLAIAAASVMSGCGGNAGSSGTSPAVPATPSGTTSFTITASVTQSGITVSHPITATLTVQ
jgi:hypothetical protein